MDANDFPIGKLIYRKSFQHKAHKKAPECLFTEAIIFELYPSVTKDLPRHLADRRFLILVQALTQYSAFEHPWQHHSLDIVKAKTLELCLEEMRQLQRLLMSNTAIEEHEKTWTQIVLERNNTTEEVSGIAVTGFGDLLINVDDLTAHIYLFKTVYDKLKKLSSKTHV